MKLGKQEFECERCQDTYEVKGNGCPACCSHDEHDHFVCLDCGAELDPGAFIDHIMSKMEDR